MMPTTNQNDNAVLLQIHKDNVEAIHAALESQGGDIAKKSRELRVLYRSIIDAHDNHSQQPAQAGFYSKFNVPIDAILACLFVKGAPCDKNQVIEEIVEGGFPGKVSGAKQAIQDSIKYQTNAQNNGKKNLFMDSSEIISLTELGQTKAQKVLSGLPMGAEIISRRTGNQ